MGPLEVNGLPLHLSNLQGIFPVLLSIFAGRSDASLGVIETSRKQASERDANHNRRWKNQASPIEASEISHASDWLSNDDEMHSSASLAPVFTSSPY
jgi:hypothetical protein